MRIVLQILRREKLYTKLSKCEFWLKSVAFLGHIISGEGVAVDRSKVQAVKDWPILTSATDIRSFLGLARYYRRFVQDFSRIAEPLIELTQKGVKYIWTAECANIFEELKNRLTTVPILKMSDGTGGMVIYSDGSGRGSGVC